MSLVQAPGLTEQLLLYWGQGIMSWENPYVEQLLAPSANSKRVMLVTNSGSHLVRNIAQKDLPTWETLIMTTPLREFINRDWWVEGWSLEKFRERDTSVVRRKASREERSPAQFSLKMGLVTLLHFSYVLWKGNSHLFFRRSCTAIFWAFYCWIFLTHNTYKLEELAQKLHSFGLFKEIQTGLLSSYCWTISSLWAWG